MKISKLLAAIFCLGLFILAACTPTAQNKALVLDEVQVESSYVTPMQDEDYSKQQIQGTKYYFSSSEGSLNGTGSMESPWSDFSKLEQLQLQPGDGVYLKCGDVFENQALTIKNSGTKEAPITISSYGTGEYPIILGGGEVYDKVLSLVPSFTARVGINLKNVTGVSIRGIAIYSAEFGVWSRSDTIQDPAPFVIEDCIFQDIWGYRCIKQEELNLNISQPVYSNALVVLQEHSDLKISDCKFYDCEAGMHVRGMSKGGTLLMENIIMDNMFREGILLENTYCSEAQPGQIKNCTITNTGCVYGMFWGVTALQFNVCENIVCDSLDLSYTGNGDYRLDMTGGDYEATNKNITIKNSRIHNNAGSAWLIYKNPTWGTNNSNTSIENCYIANNGLQNTDNFPAFIRHYFNEDNGGRIVGNEIWLANETQKVNYIDPVGTDEFPKGYTVENNVVKGVYQPQAVELPEGTVKSFEFDRAYDLNEFYGFLNTMWAYPNGNYLYIRPKQNDSRSEQCEVISKDRLGLDLSTAEKLVIRVKNKTNASKMKIAFNTVEDYSFAEENSITFPISSNDRDFVEYTLDIGSFFADRGGKIDRIKLFPCIDVMDGWVAVDYMRFVT